MTTRPEFHKTDAEIHSEYNEMVVVLARLVVVGQLKLSDTPIADRVRIRQCAVDMMYADYKLAESKLYNEYLIALATIR